MYDAVRLQRAQRAKAVESLARAPDVAIASQSAVIGVR